MNAQVHFVVEHGGAMGLNDDRLGVFDMTCVPDVGETVELQGAEYIVVSRRWVPKKILAHVTIVRRA